MTALLSTVTFVPMLGGLALVFVPRRRAGLLKTSALLIALLVFALSLPLYFGFDGDSADFQFEEQRVWMPTLGVSYHVGIDGISLLLVLLTTFLMPLALASAWGGIEDRVKEFVATMLILETGMLGVFVALDLFLFYVFWEAMLIPMYFLIGIWGHERRIYAAIKFFIYTFAGSALMLVGFIVLYRATGLHSFDLALLVRQPVSAELQMWLFGAFALAFAIKVPMFPFHTWLPDAHVEAPTAGSVILAGVLLKMGTYGFVRFSLPFFPDVVMNHKVRGWMIGLSIVGIIYGALVSLMQKDMKKLVAYSSVSHLGFCTLGIFVLNSVGLSGSVLQQINHGISTGALFLIVGILYERRHTREISEYGGISNVMPVYATIYLIVSLSSLGMPLLNGFVGEFTILQGTFMENWRWAAWAVPGVILAAAYLLWLYQRVFFGAVTNPKNEKLHDLTPREVLTFVPLIIMALWIGLYPKPFFQILEQPVNQIVQTVRPGNPAARTGSPAAEEPSPVDTSVQLVSKNEKGKSK